MARIIFFILMVISCSCFSQTKTINYYQVLRDSSTNYTYVLDSIGQHLTAFNSSGAIIWTCTPHYTFKRRDNIPPVCCMQIYNRINYDKHGVKKEARMLLLLIGLCEGWVDLISGKYTIGDCD